MANLRDIIDCIRNFFQPVIPEFSRKRRAVDSVDHWLSPKSRRLLHSSAMSKDVIDLDSDNFVNVTQRKKSPIFKTPPSRILETIVLDEDEIVPIKRGNETRFERRSKFTKYTSTPAENGTSKPYVNGTSDEDDVILVKEIKPKVPKKIASSRIGSLTHVRPFTGASFLKSIQKQKKSKEQPKFLNNIVKKPAMKPAHGSLDYSFRLDDKMNYKKLLEMAAANVNDTSVYSTPVGKWFNNYDTANQTRSGKILNMSLKSPVSSPRMSTKDTIKKVLDNFESEMIVLKDSDSDSDVIFVNPPSPKPDIKVDPVNSLKVMVDTSQQTKPDWIDKLVERHKNYIQQRQQEVDELRAASEKHGQINKDMRMEILTDKVNRALLIKEAVLPVDEKDEEAEFPSLTNAHLKLVDRAFRGDSNEILIKKFNLNISRRDLMTLAGLNWLNDEVINFYMNLIIERGKNSKWPKTYAFNTFFYSKLIKDGPQSLRRWTKRVDLFEYDLICVPIHLGMHWCMAIIDFRDMSIKYYDSMGGDNNRCLEALRRYLEAEHMDKKKSSYDTSDFSLENVKDIPQQMNGSDCGMFSCTFAEFLTRNARINFSQEHMPYLRKKMVVEILSGELLIQ